MTLLDIIMAQIVGRTLLYICCASEAQELCYGKMVESVSLGINDACPDEGGPDGEFVLHFTDGSSIGVDGMAEVRFS